MVCQELIPHARAEEKTIYALFRIRALEEDKEMLDLANEGYEEHLVADGLIENLKTLSTDDERWIPMFKVLKDILEHHIHEEESEIFKECKKVFSKEEQSLLLNAYLASKEKFLDNPPPQSEIDERAPSKEIENMFNF
jgi:hemerythrin superfamily protein